MEQCLLHVSPSHPHHRTLTPSHPHTIAPSHPHTLTPSNPHTFTLISSHLHPHPLTPSHPHSRTPSLPLSTYSQKGGRVDGILQSHMVFAGFDRPASLQLDVVAVLQDLSSDTTADEPNGGKWVSKLTAMMMMMASWRRYI